MSISSPQRPVTTGRDREEPLELGTPELRTAELAAARAGDVGRVHSWELVTAVDGPGTRLTLFLSGCPLRC